MGELDEMIAKVVKQIEEQLRRFGEIGVWPRWVTPRLTNAEWFV